MNSTSAGSLFTGAGMLDIAVHQVLRAAPAWFVENDPAASKVLTHHFPNIPNHADVTTVDWAAVEPIQVLTGGFPCQDVSTAGKRAGMRPGTRSGLWSHMRYAISQLRPELVVIENVRGLLSADAHCDLEPCPWCLGDNEGRPLRALGAVLGDLAQLGYDARWHGLRAADVGAPHGRFRIFIVAWPATHTDSCGSNRWTDQSRRGSTVRTTSSGSSAVDTYRLDSERRPTAELERETRPTPRLATDSDSIGLQGNERGPRTINMRRRPTDETGTIAADANSVGPLRCGGPRGGWSGSPDHCEPSTDPTSDGWREGRPQLAGLIGGPDAALSGDAPPADTSGTRSWVHEPTRPATIRDDPPAHNPRTWIAPDGTDYGPAIHRWETILGRAAPDPTQTGARRGRKLSGRFTEWMMGWPQGWITEVPGVSVNDQIRICGNGVVPHQAAAALRHLLTPQERAA